MQLFIYKTFWVLIVGFDIIALFQCFILKNLYCTIIFGFRRSGHKYSYCQGMPTYVLVNIKYLLTLKMKFTWHLTYETLAHSLKIRLWVSVVLVPPAKYSGNWCTFVRWHRCLLVQCWFWETVYSILLCSLKALNWVNNFLRTLFLVKEGPMVKTWLSSYSPKQEELENLFFDCSAPKEL